MAPLLSSPELDRPLAQPPETRRRRPLLKGVGIAGLAFVAFVIGQNTAPRRDVLMMASNASVPPASAAPTPAVPRYEQAFPLRAPTPEPSQPSPPGRPAAEDQVPQAFARQLQQPVSITPPPGSPAPAGAASGAKPFGLED